jgi:hypothetical protein
MVGCDVPCSISGDFARYFRSTDMTHARALALTGLLALSGAAFAQGTPEDPSKHTGSAGQGAAMTGDAMWDDLDTNKDGYLTKDELQGSPALVTHCSKIDTDGDGKISPAEWKAYGHHDKMQTKP